MASVSTTEKKGKGYFGYGKWAKYCLNYLPMHCFGKTEAVIFIQLDFISQNYALCLNCFSHFTKLILRKSKKTSRIFFWKASNKGKFDTVNAAIYSCWWLPPFPCISLSPTSCDTLALRLLWLGTLLGLNSGRFQWCLAEIQQESMWGSKGALGAGISFPQDNHVQMGASFSALSLITVPLEDPRP